MKGLFKVFFSNQLEVLCQNLKQVLFGEQASPFKRRLVVVHGPAMKTWLSLQMAQDPQLRIATGVEIVYLNQAFQSLLTHHTLQLEQRDSLPSSIELALAIEREVLKALKHFSLLNCEEQQDWLPLLHYLKLDAEDSLEDFKLSRKVERRLISLCQQIASHFQDYGRSSYRIMAGWEAQPQGWQQRLWKTLFGPQGHWTYPAREFQRTLEPSSQDEEIHFFSLSFITKSEFEFLGRLSLYTPIYYYLLSPCAVFWSDIRSDRESAYLLSNWQEKETAPNRLAALEEFLRDRNPLLANFGRLGREMSQFIEESLAQTEACYVLPDTVQELQQDFEQEDVHFIPSSKPLTLLEAIQADMLLMRNPQESPVVAIREESPSIQVHIASTKKREVEVLYHTLLKLIDQKKGALCPADIIVMAPNIVDYAPYIHSKFGSPESQLDFQVLDLGIQAHNEIVQGFLHLLTLSESRWEASHLLQLFELPTFQRRHQLTQGDYYTIQQWIEKVGIRWGEDLSHRNELLKRYHCVQEMVEESLTGTWDDGLTRLLLGLTTANHPSHLSQPFEAIPFDSIDFSQGDLLGRWIRLLHALRDDLSPLHDNTRMTLDDWVDYLHCLVENYVRPDFSSQESVEHYQELKDQFESLRAAGRYLKEATFSFQTIKTHLQSLLQQRKIIFRENHLQTVRFCSMLPLRSIPAKVIALLGMHEEAFPRVNENSSLNLMSAIESADYFPQSIDYDRYLFLEALQSAREHFLLFYQGYNQTDGKEMLPSLVVDELLVYLNKYYTLNGVRPSDLCVFRHPFDPFHATYFKKGTALYSFSQKDFQAAQAYYKQHRSSPHRFVQEFRINDTALPALPKICTIDLKYLNSVARNPIKFHLNHVLEIYLEKDEDRKIKDEEDFMLSHLDKYQLKQSALKEPLDQVLVRAEKEGRLPLGLFKQVASKRVQMDVQDLYERLQKHEIEPRQIFQIEFHTSCQSPTQTEADHWMMPPLKVDVEGHFFQITGKLPYVTPRGLLAMSKNSIGEAWKSWPQFLVYHYAADLHPDLLEKNLILSYAAQSKKAFFEDSKPYLKRFIRYYLLCLKNFSPLLPDWIPSIINQDVRGLEDKIKQVFYDPFSEYQHHDLRWALNKDHLPNSELLIEQWKGHAEELAGDMIQNWYPGREKEC